MTTWIYTKRKALGLSQTEVAEMLGVSRPTYTKLEKGRVKPTSDQKMALSRVFGMSEEAFEKHSQEIKTEDLGGDVWVRETPIENVKKFEQVLLYILGKVGSRPNIGQMALYKLLYFIDFDYYEKYEEQFVGAVYIKNTYGPTPVSFAKIVKSLEKNGKLVEVKSKYFGYDQTKYLATGEAEVSLLNGREIKHIDDELERLAHLSGKELSDLSHIDTPWRIAQDREQIDYEFVFYRPEETSVREYEPL
jgi:transcriptional regulator with XRE-family HTH domain